MDIIEGVYMANYQRPSMWNTSLRESCSGVVIVDPEESGIHKRMFHPYTGAPPIHCAAPAGYRTYHRSKGYS